MSFQPVLPMTGYAGWRFLSRTAERQQALVAEAPLTRRDTEAFRSRIASVTSAAALVNDRQLLKVALGAFGLDDDINNKAFLQKVLESGAGDRTALANKLADKRYLEFALAFGFAEAGGPFNQTSAFAERMIARYETRQFEIAIGDRDENLRLALTATRELEALATGSASDNARWFTVMGNPPLRQVFETALGLPSSFGKLDIDRQLETLRDKTERALGDGEIGQFADAARREDLVRLFLLRGQIAGNAAMTRGSTALTLLQAMPRPASPFG